MDEVRALEFFPLREAVFFLAQLDAPHEERHIPGQGSHGLQALRILGCLAGLPPMNAVPVLAGGHRHSGDGEELVQLVEGRGQPAPPGDGDGGADLHRLVKGRAEKKPGQKGHQRSVGGGVVDRAAYYKTVASLELRGNFIDGVVKDAPALFRALAAGDTASDGFVSHLDNLGFDTLGFENRFHLPQSQGGIPVRPGTAVNHQNLHMGTSMGSG